MEDALLMLLRLELLPTLGGLGSILSLHHYFRRASSIGSGMQAAAGLPPEPPYGRQVRRFHSSQPLESLWRCWPRL